MLNPVTVKLKILFQDVCCEKFAWNNNLPQSYLSVFYDIGNGLREVQKVLFERVYFILTIEDPITSMQVHGFCDASDRAYGCCIYLRFLLKSDFFKVVLVSAKSRVSPLRKLTILRLKLPGNLLLSQLISSFINNLTSVHSIDKMFAWTDFSIAYAWMQNINKVYKSFIQT